MAYLSPALTLMAAAAKKAAVALARDFNELEHLQTSVHNDGSFAARSYEKAKRVLCEELAKFKPDYAFVCEKTDAVPASGNYFAVNAIDGLENFAHGNAKFAIVLALVENNQPVDAVVYNPISDELFFAEKGTGAFKEGFRSHERLRVAGRKTADKALVGCTASLPLLQKALAFSSHVVISGSSALDLAYVAAGKLDLAAVQAAAVNTLAAALLLVKEAGGYVAALGQTDVRSEDLPAVLYGGNLLACNEALRQKAAAALV